MPKFSLKKLIDIIIVQGAKDLASIKTAAKRKGRELSIRRSGKEGRFNLYTVRVYKGRKKKR